MQKTPHRASVTITPGKLCVVLLNWPALKQWGFPGASFHSSRHSCVDFISSIYCQQELAFSPGTKYCRDIHDFITRINCSLLCAPKAGKALNLESYFHTWFPAWYKFISSLRPPKLGIPYMFVEEQPSEEPVCNSRLGTKCYMISNLFTCIWYLAFLNFPNWLMCNFTLFLKCQ